MKKIRYDILKFYILFFIVGLVVGFMIPHHNNEPVTMEEEINLEGLVTVYIPTIEDDYTVDEINLMCACVYAEAGSHSDKLQQYVCSVILNRVESNYFPDSIHDVIYQKNPLQYACVVNGSLDKFLTMYQSGKYTDSLERCRDNVVEVLKNGSLLPSNVVFQAGFKQGKGTYEVFENTYFCYV